METTRNSPLKTSKRRLVATAASLAIAGAIGFGAIASGTLPVRADAVRVETTQQNPGFADVVERVSPAVVSVRVTSDVAPVSDNQFGGQQGIPGFDDLPRDHPLNRFFREFRGDRQEGPRGGRQQDRAQRAMPTSQGSGFFISKDGYLVTNNHVVQGGTSFTVVLDDGTELPANLVGTDPRTDLAVLKVDEADHDFTYVSFADDSAVRVGEWVVAVGNPFGLGGSVTAGIVSARGRDIGAGPYDDFLQIDAAVNRGNSGGPAFNLNGEVVGINTAIFSPSGGNVGIAFAIPSSTAESVVTSLIDNGSVVRGWLGVQIQPVTEDIADSLGLDGAKGALISEAQANGPALAAGIKAGDVVTAVNGEQVASPRELARLVGNLTPGDTVTVDVWRNGATQEMQVELGTLPGDEQLASATPSQTSPSGDVSLAGLGLTVVPSEDGAGLLVTNVDPDSAAAERGIQAGDVIASVNSQEVNSQQDVETAVASAEQAGRNAVLLQVNRDNANHFVALPIAQG
ncbi:Do family serine endopeptidase [Aliihoeflea aestuarii]|jgi:serine protease Do|uniref:Do family serine endopeptidase n=1 Tax=Aliihoeflea aestuarii TaxID=453840 RepID=UPI00209309B2|nr:Do family serine endopeptidase [Aliihoeflea aestuarii]MCO6389490.1 Do family serine endopeptidase [Aliihoeflea aestuarii]